MSKGIKNREEFLKAFGQHLKSLREAKGLTSDELAFRCLTEKTTISRFENGHHAPGLDQLALLAKGLDLNLSEFMEGFDFEIVVD